MKPNWFVAFTISPGLWYEDIYKSIKEPMHSFHPDDLHSTVAFLGSLDDEGVESIKRAMDSFDERPLSVTLGKLLFLPKLPEYSAVSYSVEQGNEILQGYMKKYRDSFYVAAKRAVETRPPLPHITIARPPRKLKADEKVNLVKDFQKLPIPRNKIIIDTLALYTWSENRSFCQNRQFDIVYIKKLL